jgi:hypothetical protein
VNVPGQPLKIRIEVLAMPMGELPLDEVASQPSEVERPVLVHSCCRLGHSANPPGFRLSFGDWLRPLALPLTAGTSALRQQHWKPGSRHESGAAGTQALLHLAALCLRREPTRRSDDVRVVRRRSNRSVNLPQRSESGERPRTGTYPSSPPSARRQWRFDREP